jgi:hypothetical protein
MQLHTCSSVAVLGAAWWLRLRAHQVRKLGQANLVGRLAVLYCVRCFVE